MNIPLDRFEQYLKNKNLKERTIQNYTYYFMKFTAQVYNQETVSQFLALPQNRNPIARSFLLNLQHFIKHNHKELGISQEIKSEALSVELPRITGRTKKRIIKPIPHDEIPLLEPHLQDEREKIMLYVSYYAGLRLGELIKIDIMAFNWADWKKNPEQMGECRVYGKGDKERIAIIPGFLMKRIANYIQTNKEKFVKSGVKSRIFINNTDEKLNGIKLKNLGRSWEVKLREAGIKSGLTKTDGEGNLVKETIVHPHRLRHSIGSHLMNDLGIDIRKTQEHLGHSSIQSTQIYTYISKEQLKKDLQSLNKPQEIAKEPEIKDLF